MWLKQSTAITVKLGPFVDDADGKTAETLLVIQKADVRLSKNGGNMGAANADQGVGDAGAPHDEIGYYDVSLDDTDTGTLGRLKVMVHEVGALPVWASFMVVPANVWDSLFGADKLIVDVEEIGAGIITAAAIATNAIDGDAIAASAAEEIADQVWDEAIAGHLGVGSTGATLSAAGGVSPPDVGSIADAVWDEAAAGHVGVGSFGKYLGGVPAGDTLAADIADVEGKVDDLETRLGVPADLGGGATIAANLADIEGQTDDIGVAGAGLTALGDARLANLDAAVSTRTVPGDEMDLVNAPNATALQAIADEVLSRGISNVEATAPDRSLSGAIATAVNKVEDNGLGGIVVYQTDDATPLFTRAITTDPALEPIESIGGAV